MCSFRESPAPRGILGHPACWTSPTNADACLWPAEDFAMAMRPSARAREAVRGREEAADDQWHTRRIRTDSLMEYMSELESKSIVVADKILVLVNRSGMTELDGRKIIALIDHKMPIWTPDECPLCQQGSEAVRPKAHWDQLTADYSA